jgi:hypothetical protein
MEHLDLRANPIGKAGTRPLLRMYLESEVGEDDGAVGQVDVQIEGCDFNATDPTCWFNVDRPAGTHTLRLHVPYDFAVGAELQHIAATTPDAAITKLVINDSPFGAITGDVALIRVRHEPSVSVKTSCDM